MRVFVRGGRRVATLIGFLFSFSSIVVGIV